ncbi:MAG: DNA-binding response regulator [Deltaproteobacteria bacterium RIFOXYD12_FULL_56_24]|nr:MAG: DNA-binding response regulator [Deltaproteobacteria bacterium RIFOXYD12_FULL_56_24]
MKIKVIIVDDHQMVREGLRSLLVGEKDMEVIAEAGDGWEGVRLAEKLTPDVVIMDIAMPELNGIEATRQILARTTGVRVMVLSMHSDKRFVERTLKAGASGYLLKDCAFEELVRAIRTVMAGQIYLSPGIASLVVREYLENGLDSPPVLSAREREVLQLITEGKSTREISLLLHISIKTVETHRQQIMKKLHLRTVAELTKYAIREGLTTLDS